MGSELTDFKARYRAISALDREMVMSIHEAEFAENLLWPLRHAKTSYLLGNFVGAIALCGIVAEKIAVLIHALEVPDEHARNDFEKLDQVKRVEQLKEFSLLNAQIVQDFGAIRAARKKYLHYWTRAKSRTANDALQSYAAATRLVLGATGITFTKGVANLKPQVIEYLRSRGALQDDAG